MSRSSPESGPQITWKARLACLLSGCILVLINFWAIRIGKLRHISERYHQPVFVSEVEAVGIVLMAAGLAPAWLILKLTALKKYHPFKLGRQPSSPAKAGLTKPAKPK